MRSALAILVLVGGVAWVGGARAEPLAYVALANARKVAVVDVGAGKAVRMFSVVLSPHGVAASRDGRLIFVPDLLLENRGDGTVTVIDLARLEVKQALRVGEGPEHLTASPDGRWILVALPAENLVAVIDAERLEVTRRIPVAGDPHQIAF